MALTARQLKQLRKQQKRREKLPAAVIGALASVARPKRAAATMVFVPENHGQRPSPAGPLKMSAVISHLAEPLCDEYADSPADLRWIIILTTAAWNMTLLSADRREEKMESLRHEFFQGEPEGMNFIRWACDLIAERKRQFYPHLNRIILDVFFTPEPDGSLYFEVMYSS